MVFMESGRLNGRLITEYMRKKRIAYGSLAADIGVSPSLLRQMEEGYLPSRGREAIVSRLAKILGCSVGALFTQVVAKTA